MSINQESWEGRIRELEHAHEVAELRRQLRDKAPGSEAAEVRVAELCREVESKAAELKDLRAQIRYQTEQLASAHAYITMLRGTFTAMEAQLAHRIQQSQTLERDIMNRFEPEMGLLQWELDVLKRQRDQVLEAMRRHRRTFRRHHPRPCGLEAHVYRIYCQDPADLNQEEDTDDSA